MSHPSYDQDDLGFIELMETLEEGIRARHGHVDKAAWRATVRGWKAVFGRTYGVAA